MVDLTITAAMQQGRKMKPRGRPFPKGTSGNPKGRPKEYEQVKAAAREYTVELIKRMPIGCDQMTVAHPRRKAKPSAQ